MRIPSALFLGLALSYSFHSISQDIVGKVMDEYSYPIEDVYISYKLSGHTHTNDKGEFYLNNVNQGDTLWLSHIAYESQSVVIEDITKEILIRMKEDMIMIDNIVIRPNIKALNVISKIDLFNSPVTSSQEILLKVPGLIIGQHAGGGKAEQIFLRGFDIDHGTDIAIDVDGIPVNMVSHAHGQGYSDLHFVIPETIDKIDFGKGPYYVDKGNFSTAGYVGFETLKSVKRSSIIVEYGQFNTHRTTSIFNLINKENHQAYLASEYIFSDGYFEAPQDFNRLNLFGKYSFQTNPNDRFTLSMSYFDSSWQSSGQIPDRAVKEGIISRFGSITNGEGGTTGRKNIKLDYQKEINDRSYIKNIIYYSQYDFELYSDFTFFLNHPLTGDQILQKENRHMFGASSTWNQSFSSSDHLLTLGIALRSDRVYDSQLLNTANRTEIIDTSQYGNIVETNYSNFANIELNFGSLLVSAGLRGEYFQFTYYDKRNPTYSTLSAKDKRILPKLGIIYNYNPNLQFYLKSGFSLHSNDARVILSSRVKESLPTAFGQDLGLIWKPYSNLFINAALWNLTLQQEFIYVGDEGIVEPSGRTRRTGIDLGIRSQLLDWLNVDMDINYANARNIGNEKDEDYIPLAVGLSSSGGIGIQWKNGLQLDLKYRYIADRPADENNIIVANGYFITDLNLGYKYRSCEFGIQINNLFNTEWNETQFSTLSRLAMESEAVEEIHFTPGSPFFLKGRIKYSF